MSGSDDSGPLYPNQPLQEVATEIRFRGNLRVEQIRADFQDSIRDKYSVLKVPNALPGVSPAVQPYRLERPDDECGVQLAVNSIGVYARQYPGFQSFIEEAGPLVREAHRLIGSIDLTRVGWRYINAIPFPRKHGYLPFAEFFQRQPWLASALEGQWQSYGLATRMPFRDAKVHLQLAAGDDPETSKLETLIFDIDAYLEFDPVLENATADDCLNAIEQTHAAAREIFELSINDAYRRFLRGDAR